MKYRLEATLPPQIEDFRALAVEFETEETDKNRLWEFARQRAEGEFHKLLTQLKLEGGAERNYETTLTLYRINGESLHLLGAKEWLWGAKV
jgi:hypothetical protein